MIVLIDDERNFVTPLKGAMILRNSSEALRWLKNNNAVVDQLWLDHDLGIVDGAVDSIIPVVRWLEEQCFFGNPPNIREVIVHTSNNVGGVEIVRSLSRYYKTIRVFAGDYLTNY